MLLKELRERLLKDINIILLAPERMGKPSDSHSGKINLAGITVSEPKNKSFGDISTNAAMVLAPLLKDSPMKIAETLSREIISRWDEAGDVSIAKPGFINFYLDRGFLQKALAVIAAKNKDYGKNDSGRMDKVQIEFVSANPTGSLHIGHGRWAALGDSLCNIYFPSLAHLQTVPEGQPQCIQGENIIGLGHSDAQGVVFQLQGNKVRLAHELHRKVVDDHRFFWIFAKGDGAVLVVGCCHKEKDFEARVG